MSTPSETKSAEELEGLSLGQQFVQERYNAQPTSEPGTMKRDEIINTFISGADVYNGAPLAVSQVTGAFSSAGYSVVYRVDTGERIKVNNNMMPGQLKKRFHEGPQKGQRAFSTVPTPVLSPGTDMCFLHPDSPFKAEMSELGFPPCYKSNLRSSIEAREHMKKKHKREWANVVELRDEADRVLNRDFQRAVIAQSGGKLDVAVADRNPAIGYVDPTDGVTILEGICNNCQHIVLGKGDDEVATRLKDHMESAHPEEIKNMTYTASCDKCGFVTEEISSNIGAISTLNAHKRKEHPEGPDVSQES